VTATPEPTFAFTEEFFTSGGVRCAARVYRPVGAQIAPRPVIVMAHGFGAVRALRLDAYAERFAAAGYIVVAFDYRGFGDSEGEPRQVLNIKAQQADWRAALQYARKLSDTDGNRVVAWGTSFAGGHVITLAGRGEPLAAIIAQVPHISGPAAVRATGLRASLRLAPFGLLDQLRAWVGRSPVYVESAGATRTTAVMTTPDALDGMEKLIADSGLAEGAYPTTVAARIVLRIGAYSPGRHAKGVTCPALVQIAEQDAITPTHVAQRAARKMAHPTVRTYDCGHFDPYVEPIFSTVVSDQLAFLEEHVPVHHDR
jgi:uncharacterized protein